MSDCQPTRKKTTLIRATKSFVGYLEGSGKASHTISNYQSDLRTFQEYVKDVLKAPIHMTLPELGSKDLENYGEYLKTQGLKSNSRRRKMMTVRKLLGFLNRRNQMPEDQRRRVAPPAKVERIPVTVDYEMLLQAVQNLQAVTEMERRNRLLLWFLVETGCLVSEAALLQFADLSLGMNPPCVQIRGKGAREVEISALLAAALDRLQTQARQKTPWLFLGYNRVGPLGSHISPRGIELLLKSYSQRLGVEGLTPRLIRHTTTLHWFKQGVSQAVVQKRLGLKTDYAFRVYQPLLKIVEIKTVETNTAHSETD